MHLNADLLAQHGYWVPTDFSGLGFPDLGPLARQGEVISGNLAPMHALLSEGGAALVPGMEAHLFRHPDAPDGCDVVLSSEMFFYYWACTLQVARGALRFGFEPTVVVYVARQDRAAIAAYLQNVRHHGYTQGVIDFLNHDNNVPYCHYFEILQRMRIKMPDLRIECRTCEDRFLDGGDILSDFLGVLGGRVGADRCDRPPGRSNEGLLAEQYELLRAAKIGLRNDAIAHLRSRPQALRAEDRARTQAFYYKPDVERFLTARYLAENQSLVACFMPDASESERSFWRNFDPADEAAGLDMGLFARLRAEAFGPDFGGIEHLDAP